MKRPSSPLRLFGPKKKTALFRKDDPELFIAADSAFFTKLLERKLRDARLRVRSAALAEDALEAIAAQPPDLVLVSGSLPDLTGIEFVRRLRANNATQFIPLIIISARDRTEDIAEALEAGADDYLTKPFEFPLLKARIDNQFRIRALRAELERSNAYLRDLGRFKDELLTFCSHDLKVPINTILWHAEALRGGLLETPEQSQEALLSIEKSGQRVIAYIDDALELARLGSGFSIRDEPLSLAAILEDARKLVAGRASQANLALILANTEPRESSLRGDSVLLVRLFQNLFIHAIDRSPKGGNIYVKTGFDDGYLEVEITDRGPPANDEPLAAALKEEKQAGEAETIGLAICREIIERHFGAITLGQSPEGGGLMRVLLPLMPPGESS